ncbi:S1 family peptidase [Actinacidiphila acididurans]|uniref:Trypsin-like peptidase domain-containing protein n=1 Tax=Actinacidiphila acididurans TaxID=2784346 RepID=A0ABS2TTY7_9ACTN|nr:serine protease [Actinacidiphila acididurans]MBM9506287.1 trypsin-like peptidase domain-containing protein [Actinacidiphila acididurans]
MAADVSALFGAVVRIRSDSGAITGAGFLVAPGLVCTCAHVVARALGADPRSAEPPRGSVRVDLPLLDLRLLNPELPDPAPDASRAAGSAVVTGWRPILADDTGDLALLRMDPAPPRGTAVPWLVEANELWDHAVRVFGFPEGGDHGVWVAGRLRALQGAGWVQMQSEAGPAIERGFSGSPVWDTDLGGVVGITVAAGLGSRADTAYLLPAASILRAWPELAEHALPASPYRALNSFTARDERVFHGQDEAVARLETLTSRQPVVVLSGPSGSGKSSLVRAGLLPRLSRAGWTAADFRPIPGLSPARTLAGALAPLLDGELDEQAVTGLLTRAGHAEIAARLGRGHPGGVLLFADQFEEIVTADQDAARELLDLITALTLDAPAATPLRALLTVRSGSLDRMLTQHNRSALDEGVTFLAPMGREQLRTAITEPLAATPGIAHEAGLVARILDDAGEGPGRLPMVEFTLTRLWDRRRGGMLTHEAYDGFGGVAGAVADYAEEVYAKHLRPSERDPARRLFVQLARPEEDGGFTRRAVRVDALDAEQRRLVPRLADRKLLVTTQAVDGAEIADLAHDALIDGWSRLRKWLAADRDFRDWQERLRAALRQWEQFGRRTGALLRDPLLTEALSWSKERPQDITAGERAYIAAGLGLRKRRSRRGRLVTTGVAVLALIAATLAGLTYNRTQEVTRRLHAQAAQLLGQDAQRRADDTPGTAALLALSAWRTDKTQPEAYGALFKLYARLRNVTAMDELGIDHALAFTATPNGGAALVVDQRGVVSVLTGLLGQVKVRTLPAPRMNLDRTPLVTLSPDGRTVALLDDQGGLALGDVDHPDRRVKLSVPAGWNPGTDLRDLAFSPDGSRLAALFAGTNPSRTAEVDRLGLWDARTGHLVSGRPLHGSGFGTVRFAAQPNSVLLEQQGTAGGAYVRIDVRTGAEAGSVGTEFPADVGLGGRVVVDCTQSGTLRIRSLTGAALHTLHARSCADTLLDGTRRYALIESDEPLGQPDMVTVKLVDLRTGSVSWTTVPTHDTLADADTVVVPRPDGSLSVLVLKGKELLRFTAPRPGPAVDYPMPVQTSELLLGDTGRFRLLADDSVGESQLRLLDTSDGAISTPPSDVRNSILRAWDTSDPSAASGAVFTSDDRHFATLSGGSLTVYSVPGLTRQRVITLPVPRGVHGQVTGTLAAADDGSLLTLYAGELTRWDPSDGHPIEPPLPLAHGTDLTWLAANAGLVVPRPGHPTQTLVRQRGGLTWLWDLRTRRSLGTFQADPDTTGNRSTELFDASGNTLATLSNMKSGHATRIEFRRLPDFRLLAPPVPAGDVYSLVGFTPDGYLMSVQGSTLQIWRWDAPTEIADLTVPDDIRWYIHGPTSQAVTAAGSLPLPLTPTQWRTTLCTAANRPFTRAERQLLPSGSITSGLCGD